MNQQRVILAVVTLGLVSTGVWLWQHDSTATDVTPSRPLPARPFQQVAVSGSAAVAVTEPALTVTPVAQPEPAAPAATTDDTQSAATPTPSAAPANVDTPEPAQRKFAHGGHAEPEQI
jgi:hypothetical protein